MNDIYSKLSVKYLNEELQPTVLFLYSPTTLLGTWICTEHRRKEKGRKQQDAQISLTKGKENMGDTEQYSNKGLKIVISLHKD